MRKLQTSDIFNALRLIKKAKLKEELKPVMELAASGALKLEEIGLEGMLTAIEIFSEKGAEKALYEVLSGPFELPPEEIEAMDINIFAEALSELAKENDIKRFFTGLSGLISKK
jgi:hypothetical protein